MVKRLLFAFERFLVVGSRALQGIDALADAAGVVLAKRDHGRVQSHQRCIGGMDLRHSRNLRRQARNALFDLGEPTIERDPLLGIGQLFEMGDANSRIPIRDRRTASSVSHSMIR